MPTPSGPGVARMRTLVESCDAERYHSRFPPRSIRMSRPAFGAAASPPIQPSNSIAWSPPTTVPAQTTLSPPRPSSSAVTHWFAATSAPEAGSARALVSARSRTNSELALVTRSASVTGVASKAAIEMLQVAYSRPWRSPASIGPIGNSPRDTSMPRPVQVFPSGYHSKAPATVSKPYASTTCRRPPTKTGAAEGGTMLRGKPPRVTLWVEGFPRASTRTSCSCVFRLRLLQRVEATAGSPFASSARPGQPSAIVGPTFAIRTVCQALARLRTRTSVRSSELCTSATGPAAPILNAITVDPGVVDAALTLRQFPFPARVATTTRVPRTKATEDVPFAFSASWPPVAFRATISACAVPAAQSTPTHATAAITIPRPMAASYAAAPDCTFKIPKESAAASTRFRPGARAGGAGLSPTAAHVESRRKTGDRGKPQIEKRAHGGNLVPPCSCPVARPAVETCPREELASLARARLDRGTWEAILSAAS